MPHQVASLLLALFVGAAPAVPGQVAAASPRVARLELRVTTSAPLTVVRVVEGAVVAHRVVSNAQKAKVTGDTKGWTIRSTAAKASLVLTAVYEETTEAPSIGLRLRTQGGTAALRMMNASAKPFEVASLSTAASTPISTAAVPRNVFFGPREPALAKLDGRKLVLAAYYPWFGASYASPKLSDRPASPRSTKTAAGVLSMTRQASAAGIDGFVVSWAGSQRNGQEFDLVLDAARRSGTVATVYLETLTANAKGVAGTAPQSAIVLARLREALSRSANPAFLKAGGVPVVFVYEMRALKPGDWAWVLKRLGAEGKKVRLIGDGPLEGYGASEWGYHRYRPSGPGLAQWNRGAASRARYLYGSAKLFVATVSPGYDDRHARGAKGSVVPRGTAGEYYASTWEAALAARPDWVLITSWNEWFEGTSVEPSVGASDLALRQTTDFIGRFKG